LWGKTGSINDEEKQILKKLILEFEKKFKIIGAGISKVEVPI
jgi:hypothetical protein